MKKTLLTVALTLVLVLGATGSAFADADRDCMVKVWGIGKWQNYFKTCPFPLPEQNPEQEKPQLHPEQQKPEQQKPVEKPEYNEESKQAEVLNLVNKERNKMGMRAVKEDTSLNRLAQMKAEDMAQKGYFSHTSPTYGSAFDMMKEAGISYRTAGENIAKGQKTAKIVMSGWMNSSGHRANILNAEYTRLGVGYATDHSGTPYWVQIFAG